MKLKNGYEMSEREVQKFNEALSMRCPSCTCEVEADWFSVHTVTLMPFRVDCACRAMLLWHKEGYQVV